MTDDNKNIDEEYRNEMSNGDEETGLNGVPLSRRGTLAAIAGLGALGLASGTASAASTGDTLTFGNSFAGTPSSGYALKLVEQSGSGSAEGINTEAQAPSGKGITAIASGGGTNFGVNGLTFSSNSGAAGVRGKAPSTTGAIFGVLGSTESPAGKALQGTNLATTGNAIGLEGRTDSPYGYAVRGRATEQSGSAIGVYGQTGSPNGYGLYTPDDAKIDGDLQVQGTKNFVQAVNTAAGPKNVHYTAVEAGESRTEHTGVAEMEDGHALIELPAHFDMVTSDEADLAVQVTPHADEKVHPQVVDKSTRFVSVEDFGDGPDDYGFSFTVKGVRDGFEDKEIVRDA